MSTSNLTLNLFNSSGWYEVNFSMAENLEWGKNKGCEFVVNKCVINKQKAFSEFCDLPN